MVHIGKVYTKTGDGGSTSLVDGTRIRKNALRLAAYGDVDELNATLGAARCLVTDDRVGEGLDRIQNDLFDVGADLATPLTAGEEPDAALRIIATQTERLENEIDAFNEPLPDLTSFILPGGSVSAAELHRARTICRRAERGVVALSDDEDVNLEALRYLNRLSDWLFVVARVECLAAGEEVFWKPAENR